MYIKIDTKTTPHQSMTVQQAARTAEVSTVYITNKIGDDTIDHGYLHDNSEDDRGQKVVLLNQKWNEFLRSVRANRKGKMASLWVTKAIARLELNVDDGELTGLILDGKLTYSRKTNKIKKDDFFFALIKELND